MIHQKEFRVVKCVTSGMGYVEGKLYAQVGNNNGIQIQRIDEDGDCHTEIFCTGGIGKGLHNNWDDSGAPSFVDYDDYFEEVEDKRLIEVVEKLSADALTQRIRDAILVLKSDRYIGTTEKLVLQILGDEEEEDVEDEGEGDT